MITELKKHKLSQRKEQQENIEFVNSDYVFCNEYGVPYNQHTFKDTYNKYLHKLGLDKKVCESDENVTFHTLRHTFATRSLELGMDILTLSKIMGHADVSTTLNKYGHVLPNHKQECVNKLKVLYA